VEGVLDRRRVPDVPEVQTAVTTFIEDPESQPSLDNDLEAENYG